MIDFVGKRWFYFLISAILILPGVFSLVLPGGVRLGVDFTGGTLWELAFERPVEPAEVRDILARHDHGDAVVQSVDAQAVLIRTKEIASDGPDKAAIESDLAATFGPIEERRFESVGPVVGAEITQRAVLAVGVASLGILAYLWYAFRRVPDAFRYGVCAVIALLHDALFILGFYSILGRLFSVEIDTMFVTAILTVIGYSVHDSIVVFDRIRENLLRYPGEHFERIVNHSIMQTIGRSLSNSMTVIFTLTALVLFGGVTTRMFALVLLVGIAIGTYSSIFNAGALLFAWENGDFGRLLRRAPHAEASARSA